MAPLPWMLAQRLTVEQALQGLTAAGAYATFEETTKGTISQQKLADLVILDQNPLTIPTQNLADVKVLATIVGGHSEYCATGAKVLCPWPKPTDRPALAGRSDGGRPRAGSRRCLRRARMGLGRPTLGLPDAKAPAVPTRSTIAEWLHSDS